MFRPEVYHAYARSGSKLPVNTWVDVVGKNLPQFKHMDTLYRDIPIAVSLTHGGEAVKLAVSPADNNWYGKLVNVVQDMTGKKNVDIVNYLGHPIKNMNPLELSRCSICDVVDKQTQQPVRIASLIEPPKYMSSNKNAEIKSWWISNREGLAKEVANELKSLTMDEIAEATKANGKIQGAIQSYLERNTIDNTTWNEFTSSYGTGKMDSMDMAKKLLESVKLGLRANEKLIRNYHASATVGSSLWSKGHDNKYKDDFPMYRDIMEDVVYRPDVSSNVVNGILYGASTTKAKAVNNPITRSTTGFNPLQSFYKQYFYPIHGKLPEHVMDDYATSTPLNYSGDPKRAFDAFNLFSGRTIDCGCSSGKKKQKKVTVDHACHLGDRMPGLIAGLVKISDVLNIDGHHKHKHKEQQHEKMGYSIPPLVPIRSAPPPLVPIRSVVDGNIDGHHKHKHKKQAEEEQQQEKMGYSIPPLVPIRSATPVGYSIPPFLPLQSRALPPLVPIEKKLPAKKNIGKDWNKVKTESAAKRIDIPTNAQLNESPWVDPFPNLNDL